MKRYFRINFIVSVVLLLAFVMAVGAQAQSIGVDRPVGSNTAESAPVDGVTGITISQAEQDAALEFWTHERIAAAQPVEMPVDFGDSLVDESSLDTPLPGGAPGFSPSGFADPSADLIAQAAYPLDWAAMNESKGADLMGESPEGPEGTSQVYTNYIVNQASALQTMYPHRWVGRLSFSTSAGTSYCSGTSISGNVMLTAAHCLYNTTTNVWYTNRVFSPAYRNGSAPYGTFTATNCWVLTAWVNLTGNFTINGWSKHDVGVCKMGKNSANQTLNTAVGYMGRQWNSSYIRHFHTLGYPFRDYNNVLLSNAGLYLRTCAAESFQQTSETRGMGCNYGGGISGGPWMVGYAVNVVSGSADGVNSGLFIGTKNLYGPRFNSNNIVPLCTSAAC
jgi:hypothetical protein